MFADKLQSSIENSNSRIVAGLDPRFEKIPTTILDQAASKTSTNEEAVYQALLNFHLLALNALNGSIAAIKPNIAFFEQHGISGIRAFADICSEASNLNIPVIADIKRGDIGSTAEAYSAAYLGQTTTFGKTNQAFKVDAITVNPFLGFDTVETFFNDCKEYGKGLFVLVKTSNPGSGDIQGVTSNKTPDKSVSEQIATWMGDKAELLQGNCGYSGLGAVVGATYPEEAKQLRNLMPTNFFLIPGFGAQGGTANDSVAGFANLKNKPRGGATINISRALLASFSAHDISQEQIKTELQDKIANFNTQINSALTTNNS